MVVRALGRRPDLILGLLAAALALSATGAGAAPDGDASKGSLPDLVVTSVGARQQRVVAGRRLTVSDRTRNRGSRRAAASTNGYYLSSDRKRSRGDRLLGSRSVPRLAPGAGSASSSKVRVPASTPAGAYYLLACADSPRKVHESREGNNCRAATLEVAAPTPPPPPPDPDVGPDADARALMLEQAGPMNLFRAPPPVSTRTAVSTVETAHRVTKTIGAPGGQITVTDARGDTVTVTFPAHALLAPVTVTATPVATTEGVDSVGARSIGVELEPSGLGLIERATMTVVPADGITARKAEGMVSASDGTDVHPEALLPDASRLEMPVDHFTVVTVIVPDGNGTTTKYFTQSEYTATLHNMLAQAIEKARDNAVDEGGPVDVNGTIVAAADQYWHDLALPLLEESKGSCTFARANMTTVTAAAHEAAALGIDRPEYGPGLATVLQNCWQEATATCMTMAPGRYSEIVALARQMALLGVHAGDGTDPDPFALGWCGDANGYFRLTRDETVDISNGGNTIAQHEVTRAVVWFSGSAAKWWNGDGTFTVMANGSNPTSSSSDLVADWTDQETWHAGTDDECSVDGTAHDVLSEEPTGVFLPQRSYPPTTMTATETQGLSITGYPVPIPQPDDTVTGTDTCGDTLARHHYFSWWEPTIFQDYVLTVDAATGDVRSAWDNTEHPDDGEGVTHTIHYVIDADIHVTGLEQFLAAGPP